MRGLFVLLALLWTHIAGAQGFALHDLTPVTDQVRAAIGPGVAMRADPDHLVATCSPCRGAPAIDLQLGRLTDGTEQRVRSGKTTFAALEAICVRQNPDCRLSSLAVGPAIGWIGVYALDREAGATVVILRDGDLLTIAAKAADRETAADTAQRLAATVVPRIVGR